MSFKPANVVMLPTQSKAVRLGQLVIGAGNHLFASRQSNDIGSLTAYELYITSDEEIKEGDLFMQLDKRNIDSRFKPYQKCEIVGSYKFADRTGIIKTIETFIERFPFCNVGKLIASTDKSLGLPQPSQSFIKAYIEAYNSGKVIGKIMVEYERMYLPTYEEVYLKTKVDIDVKLKVDKNNEITIKPIKDSWNREEHITDLYNLADYIGKDQCMGFKDYVDSYIKENL